MRDTGVIYLYRFSEGEQPVQRFLQTYRSHAAGIDHDLNVVFKGFPDRETLARAHALFAGIPIKSVEVDDSGYDIGSYVKAANIVPNPRLFFLNTFSRILADDWLGHFNRALNCPGVGLAGATGSWAANTAGYEAAVNYLFRKIAGLPAQLHQSVEHEMIDRDDPGGKPGWKRHLKLLLLAPFEYSLRLRRYGRYPNPHIRTNAFMMDRSLFLSLDLPKLGAKSDTYKFESGRHSMTKQILRRNLRPVVVDRYGKTYGVPEWKLSSTFRTGDQVNLIVADNRTAHYAQASARHRQYMERLTWVHPWDWNSESP